eukprot:3936661-Lingulodinium_polyedra.AAC.1
MPPSAARFSSCLRLRPEGAGALTRRGSGTMGAGSAVYRAGGHSAFDPRGGPNTGGWTRRPRATAARTSARLSAAG